MAERAPLASLFVEPKELRKLTCHIWAEAVHAVTLPAHGLLGMLAEGARAEPVPRLPDGLPGARFGPVPTLGRLSRGGARSLPFVLRVGRRVPLVARPRGERMSEFEGREFAAGVRRTRRTRRQTPRGPG